MENPTQTISWYDITREIIIPSVSILSTIVIGIIIAVLLKNKEQKAKKKELLIDSYMNYLAIWTNNIQQDSKVMTFRVFKEILHNYGKYFHEHSNSRMAIDLIDSRLNKLKQQIGERANSENWSPFTYRFAFLLGKKIYAKNLQSLEDKIVAHYLSNAKKDQLQVEIIDVIQNNSEIHENMNLSDTKRIDHAIDLIEIVVAQEFNKFQLTTFNGYNTKLANLINDY